MRLLLPLCLLPCLVLPALHGQPKPKTSPQPYLAFLELPKLGGLWSVAVPSPVRSRGLFRCAPRATK
ncbi:MAG: hypothetical protein L0Z62_23960 [Gemmataceae bacterium]|nr:hypothetical protein [Gemmataceae bacterium]